MRDIFFFGEKFEKKDEQANLFFYGNLMRVAIIMKRHNATLLLVSQVVSCETDCGVLDIEALRAFCTILLN